MKVEFANFEELLKAVDGLSAMPIAVIEADEKHVASAQMAGFVVGTKVPIILTSRSDPPGARLLSCAVAALASHRLEP